MIFKKKPDLLLLCSFSLLFTLLTRPVFPVQRVSPVKNLKDTIPVNDTTDENRIFDKVDIEASFRGGDNAWRKYLELNLDGNVPITRKAPAGTYTVVIQFVVDKEGHITDIKPLTNHGYGMEEEVIRLLKKAPRWKPASQNGRPVMAYRKQPVTFQIEDERNKRD